MLLVNILNKAVNIRGNKGVYMINLGDSTYFNFVLKKEKVPVTKMQLKIKHGD
jgi:hypothetical protein